jgi:hypothetical protein
LNRDVVAAHLPDRLVERLRAVDDEQQPLLEVQAAVEKIGQQRARHTRVLGGAVPSLLDGRRLARHERGRPNRVLPDPVENSVSLAQVLSALPDPEVHRRPLDRYQEAIDG